MVYLNKQGILDFRGVSASSLFFKNLLKKLGIEMQVVKVGTYKSFTEQFTNDKMSDANREQLTLLSQTTWDNIVQSISQDRAIPEDTLIKTANEYLTFQSPEKILNLRMVDELVYPDQMENILKEYLDIDSKAKISYITPLDLVNSEPKTLISASKNKIAVVYAVGEIDNGGTNGIQSSKIFNTLKELQQDSAVKAVVLRVNSPGGSAYGSEQIWRAVSLLKETKPVVASMGDYAASGGYYISCAATRIVANPNTITGSIGIFGVIPNIEGLMHKIGVDYDVVKTNKFADMPAIYRAMTEEERHIIQKQVERGYDLFLQRCADGRSIALDSIAGIAQGRVWSGSSALHLGLLDRFGTLQDAIQLASEEAGLTSYDTEDYPQKEDWFTQLMRLPQIKIEELFFRNTLTEEKALLNKVYKIDNLQAALPFDVKVQ
jgi:protease-4